MNRNTTSEKVFVGVRGARTPAELVGVQRSDGFQIEMSFSYEDRSGYKAINRVQQRQRSFLELEGAGVPDQSKVVEPKGFAWKPIPRSCR